MSKTPKPTRIHIALGTLTLVVFLALVVADATPDYDVDPILSAFLVGTYLTLLGFGALIHYIADAKYGN